MAEKIKKDPVLLGMKLITEHIDKQPYTMEQAAAIRSFGKYLSTFVPTVIRIQGEK